MGMFAIIAAVFVGGVWWVVRRLFKWKDPSWDSRASQSKAFMWSKRGGGGGFGG